MSAEPDFFRLQYQFTRHCRDPENNPAPDNIEDRRMAIYRELLYNNIEGFMSDNFPVIRQILPADQWHLLIREYFAKHKASTPLFPKLPTEFLQFLETEHDQRGDWPFLQELAHYEWVESALMLDTREVEYTELPPELDIMATQFKVSPLIWRLAYDFPVHQIGPDYLPKEQPDTPTYLVVYRDRQDNVGFMELNAVTASLLDSLSNHPQRSTPDQLQAIADQLQHPQPQLVIQGGLEVLQQLLQRDIILLDSAEK